MKTDLELEADGVDASAFAAALGASFLTSYGKIDELVERTVTRAERAHLSFSWRRSLRTKLLRKSSLYCVFHFQRIGPSEFW